MGAVHVVAECRDCGKIWDDYKTAIASARRHVASTGHSVHVDRGQVWTYSTKSDAC